MTQTSADRVLAGLDADQRAAVTAPAGPVCVLAGAGTGKTRAITSRIAYRVQAGLIPARHVLAVTFTARAAGELRGRLAALGAGGVQARTFHAAALRQVRYFASRLLHGRAMPELLDSKIRPVTLAAARAGLRADGAAARDLAGEIEWAKASLVEPDAYPAAAAGRETPYEPARVAAVFAEYERLKRAQGVIDFEDVLRAAVWGIEEHPDVAAQVRAQYRHFVVDEYQDVNPLQQRLLDAWLGGRDDLTVVGDASQTIYSFTGATSAYLVDFPRTHRTATVVRLVRDYRSTPQVVGLANAVIGRARGSEARLRLALEGQRPPGPEPEWRIFADETTEAAAVARRCADLIAAGAPASELAVLFRTNAQSPAYEEALAAAGVPYVVRGAERYFARPEVRAALAALRTAARTADPAAPLPAVVAESLAATGWQPGDPPRGGAARERWESLAALVALATEYAGPTTVGGPAVAGSGVAGSAVGGSGATGDGGGSGSDGSGGGGAGATLGDFCAELARRADAAHVPTLAGVTLASLHAAKGLEWDAVFLVGLAEGTLPTTYARTDAAVEEERRLLYVGITRARQRLWLSYARARGSGGRNRRPCRFLPQFDGTTDRTPAPAARSRKPDRPVRIATCRVCGATLLAGVDRKLGRCADCPSDVDEALLDTLRGWRAGVADAHGVPAYVVFTDATLTALAERRPATEAELRAIPGLGPRKIAQYGAAALAIVAGRPPEDPTG
ncbi:DNA helicase [Pilimelia anulata]|uniref:DNA 3'-5' helicase n=1 Tax=Pilimelia anulata TaxID=53371 RepID=A0A8J3FB88_9ACTN|nr:ATP-dependent DNA helicase UvrD2 [Pilimelia anulata]GGK00849.1 DNA helicase [Pilimelia anulata]